MCWDKNVVLDCQLVRRICDSTSLSVVDENMKLVLIQYCSGIVSIWSFFSARKKETVKKIRRDHSKSVQSWIVLQQSQGVLAFSSLLSLSLQPVKVAPASA